MFWAILKAVIEAAFASWREQKRQERIDRDYQEAIRENERFDAERDQNRAADAARLRADGVPVELHSPADGQPRTRRGKRPSP